MRSGGEKEIEGRELELERGRETEQRMLRVSLPKILGFQFLTIFELFDICIEL